MSNELRFAGTRLAGENRVGSRIEGWPVAGAITQVFGQQSVTGSRHGGIDIAANEGTPVLAPAAGTLRRHPEAERGWEFGNWVVIDHPGTPWYSAYAHLSAFAAAEGPVEAGEVIGYVGQTGLAFGAHLHWAVSRSEWFALDFAQLADPLAFLPPPPPVVSLDARVARLERLVGGNGVRVPVFAADGTQARDEAGRPLFRMLAGEEALAFLDADGQSLHLGLALTQERVAKLEA
ncbi:MAG: M23 family metallopeptidase [Hyphomicrobiales bacterium]